MLNWLKQKTKNWLGVYDFCDLVVGGNCGLCGAWMPNEIVEKTWHWSICSQCEKG